MARIHGQIESLKRLKHELVSHGINRFSSIKEINDFVNNYQFEKEAILSTQREILAGEVEDLNLKIAECQNRIEIIKRKKRAEVEVKIDTLRLNIEKLSTKVNKSFIHKLLYLCRLESQRKSLNYYSLSSSEIISDATKKVNEIIEKKETDLKYFNENSEQIVFKRSLPKLEKLNIVKTTIDSLRPLMAGAIGENLVVKEIEKLSDDYILINDFRLDFTPPFYNKKTGDRIFSIQIDHLLIAKSGIYILETKNWSKSSLESLDLRSPVEQITRTSYALFRTLNEVKLLVNEHHWGKKQIPIRNIIVMINEKPKADFKFVKVKSLKELNNYLAYFEPVFTDEEVDRIAFYLMKLQK